MIEDDVVNTLFVEALKQAEEEGNLFWQYRSLQELRWKQQAEEFILKNKKEIEKSGNLSLLIPLSLALGDMRRYTELLKEEAREEAGFYDMEERSSEEVETSNVTNYDTED